MSIPISCPSCRADFDVPDRLAGKLIRCTTCREEFRVRGRPADDYGHRPDGPTAASSNSNVTLLIVVVAVVGFGLLAVTGAGLWLFMRTTHRPAAVRVGPVPAAPRRSAPPRGIAPDHMFPPAAPAGRFGRPADVPDGPQVVSLSNLRRVDGIAPDRPAYQVDYSVTGNPARDRERYYLVAKVAAGLSETHLFKLTDKPQGTVSFAFVPGHDPGRGFEVWVEREPLGRRQERKRVSSVVTFN